VYTLYRERETDRQTQRKRERERERTYTPKSWLFSECQQKVLFVDGEKGKERERDKKQKNIYCNKTPFISPREFL